MAEPVSAACDALAKDAGSVSAAPALEADPEERAAKRLRMESPAQSQEGASPAKTEAARARGATPPPKGEEAKTDCRDRRAGVAPVKKEYLIASEAAPAAAAAAADDDDAEGRGRPDDRAAGGKAKKDKRQKGQNTERSFGRFEDALQLCNSRAFYPEFSPRECRFGERCKMCHDVRQYLREGRRDDVETFGGRCPVFDRYAWCPSGWKCRFVRSHMREVEHADGRKELVLLGCSAAGVAATDEPTQAANKDEPAKEANEDEPAKEANEDEPAKEVNKDEPAKEAIKDEPAQPGGGGGNNDDHDERRAGIVNVVFMGVKINLSRKRVDFARADEYIKWMNKDAEINNEFHHRRKAQTNEGIEDLRARFAEPPFLPSEKRRLYFGPETPTLAPLTTQGNLPFRRLCVELGCQLTYSEMAMGMPLLQGSKSDWTLLKAHESEVAPPTVAPGTSLVFDGYDNARDLRFGAQISGNQPWIVTKAADVLNRYCPHLRLIDLNCGCPIDMVFKSGGGSALLESPGKMERMLRGMNAVSGEIPVTAKIRTGVKGNRPVAQQLLGRLAFGAREHRARLGAPGCAAVTLHGRSREQRYTKRADWGFIADCAALVKTYNGQRDALADTAAEPDARTLPNAKDGRMFFLGNGDCYSHVDYQEHLDRARVDSVMIGRGALIKPWIFEEIEKGQYLDKSATERLAYIEKFVRYGLEAWGSDELGLGFTRRFLLEWLSFTHRYVPIGLLEHLPPSLNDRPPAYRGRNELETLMASENYKDWIKITEMFLGPVHPGFRFQPKHKSNAYEAEG